MKPNEPPWGSSGDCGVCRSCGLRVRASYKPDPARRGKFKALS